MRDLLTPELISSKSARSNLSLPRNGDRSIRQTKYFDEKEHVFSAQRKLEPTWSEFLQEPLNSFGFTLNQSSSISTSRMVSTVHTFLLKYSIHSIELTIIDQENHVTGRKAG
jgi:hypothetical protein